MIAGLCILLLLLYQFRSHRWKLKTAVLEKYPKNCQVFLHEYVASLHMNVSRSKAIDKHFKLMPSSSSVGSVINKISV